MSSIASLAHALQGFYTSQLTRERVSRSCKRGCQQSKSRRFGKLDEAAEIDDDEEDVEDLEDLYGAAGSYGAHSFTPFHSGSHDPNFWRRAATGSGSLDICILGRRTFDFDGIAYATVQNAFQAQKAPRAERSNFANILPAEAVRLGRVCDIDLKTWDTNKVALMSSIILAQAEQHEEMVETLIKYKDKHIAETVICDGFWDVELPNIYKSVGRKLHAQYAQTAMAPQKGIKKTRTKVTAKKQ
eukprot:7391182-Prymnesium_polylepis.1